MATYTVEWSIEVEADSRQEAVVKVWEIMQDPKNTATHFRTIVLKEDGTTENILTDYWELLHPDSELLDLDVEDGLEL